MNLLITGSSGFLGGRLKESLKQSRGLLTPSSKELDLLDYQKTRVYLAENPVDTIIHCAGFVGGIGLNESEKSRMYSENLMMGMHLIEALEGSSTHLVMISTVCVYPGDASTPTLESQVYCGRPARSTEAYGLAKRRILTNLRQSSVKYTYLIPTNLYGPHDHFEDHRSHVVPALIKKVEAAKRASAPHIDVWGSQDVTRDLLHVEDACTAILRACFSDPENQVFNISSGVETSIGTLARLIAITGEYWGDIHFDPSKPAGAPRRLLDGSKFNKRFNWKPRIPLETGIHQTYQWYLEQLS